MDEPFGAVDAITREAMQAELEKIIAQTRQTVVFITHSIDEAITLATGLLSSPIGPARSAKSLTSTCPAPVHLG